MTSVQEDLRRLLIGSLEVLSSKEAALEYQRTVPIAQVEAELFNWWFDDAYHPDSELFCGAFTPQELHVLAEFNEFFECVSNDVCSPLPMLEELLSSPFWQPVPAAAQAALRALEGQ